MPGHLGGDQVGILADGNDAGPARYRQRAGAKKGKGGDARFSPVLDAFSRIAKTVQKDAEAAIGDRPFDNDLFFDNLETSGYVLGLPTSQARITLEYSCSILLSGDERPESSGAFLRDLMFRRQEN